MKAHFLALVLAAGIGSAAEPVTLPLELGVLKTPLKTYEGVKVTGSDTVGIRIMHEGGMARIPYERLPRELADRFTKGIDREAAKAQQEREAAEQDAYHHAMEIAVQRSQEEEAAKPPGKSITELQEDSQRVMELQGYVSRLKTGVAKAEKYIESRHQRAARAQMRAYDYYGCLNWSRARRVGYILKMAARKQEKVDQAQALISWAEQEMAYLEGAR